MTSGRNKGMQFERDICVKLSLWWSEGERDDIFWRSNASGGRATNRAKQGKSTPGQYGDISAIDPCGEPLLRVAPFELKKGYPKVSVHDLLDIPANHKPSVFWEWVQQAKQAEDLSPTAIGWFLITGRTRRKPLIWISQHLYSRLCHHGAALAPTPIHLVYRKTSIHGTTLENFFEVTHPRIFKLHL